MGAEFFIIKSGSVNVERGGQVIRTLLVNNFFGGRSILKEEKRSATVIAAERNTECWTMAQETFR